MHSHDVDSAICLDFGTDYHINNHVINGSPSGVRGKKKVYEDTYSSNNEPSEVLFFIHVKKIDLLLPLLLQPIAVMYTLSVSL